MSHSDTARPRHPLRIYHHDDYARHVPPSDHPESPTRWPALHQAINNIEKTLGPQHVDLITAPRATSAQITALHPAEYWQALCDKEPQPGEPPVALDPDTWLGAGSLRAAARGAGAALDGMAHSWASGAKVFCAARPPGHHAGLASPMGFCLINPIAIAAHHARHELGAARVAIVDFDVHHGNGTQDIFAANPSVLYASSHQQPLYPGTGNRTETGVGNLINRPLPPGTGSQPFRTLWQDDILPQIADFQPECLLVSAGFDGHADDPLAQLQLHDDDYAWIGRQLAEFADQYCGGRLVAMSEGGYNINALTRSVTAFLHGLSGEEPAAGL